MTCIIALKDETYGKVYMGSDRKITTNTNVSYGDKIIIHKNIMIGCAGERGIMQICELFAPTLDFTKYDIAIQKLTNILLLFKNVLFEVLITDGNEITYINPSGWAHRKEHNFYCIGTGQDIVFGSLISSKEKDPKIKIEQALIAVSKGYSSVGTDTSFDIFP